MASFEIVELHSGSSDDEFQEPLRKPIGWNYQAFNSKTIKANSMVNGTAAAAAPPAPAPRPSASPKYSLEMPDDDLEIIEMKVEPKKNVTSLPPSSSRSEIRRQIRGVSQASISKFCVSEKIEKKRTENEEVLTFPSNSFDKNRLEEETVEGKEEDEDNSLTRMEQFLNRWEEIKAIRKDDERIRDKLWKYYHLAHTSYTHSKRFVKILELSTRRLTVDNIYVLIKDLLDCLKQYKDTPYREEESGEESARTSRKGAAAPIVEDSKISSKLRKVEKKMKELSNKIKELEKQEVDLDDDVNSSYLVEERIKRQFNKLHDYYCRLANCSTATGRPTERKFKYRGSRWMEINKRITAWVNKNKEFPDYLDILNLVKKVTKQSSLPLRPETVRVQAQEIFREVGRILKDRRVSDDMYGIFSYVEEEEEDPAAEDEELRNKLNENEKVAENNLEKIFQEYVDKDNQQREAVDLATKKRKTPATPVKQNGHAQDPFTLAKSQEGESSKIEGRERAQPPAPPSSSETERDAVVENDTGSCWEGDRTAGDANKKVEEVEEEDSADDVEYDLDDDGEDEDEDDDDDDDEEEDEDEEDLEEDEERETTKDQATSEVGGQEVLDEGDETDDDVKVVLASACMDEEEEEDSEEDIPVVDSEELIELEGQSSTCEDNAIVFLTDDSREEGPTTSTAIHNGNERLFCTPFSTTAFASSTNAFATSSTTPVVTVEHCRKHKLEKYGSSPSKRICLESPDP